MRRLPEKFPIIILFLGLLFPAQSAQSTTGICIRAAQIAALEYNVPVSVLTALTLTETGRKKAGQMTPWPWSTNVEGKGRWFETRADAENYITSRFAEGSRSFDVGCFQLNYRWHGYKYGSPIALFDPNLNAGYAARFIRSLFEETGDWSLAAGAYHSRTPRLAARYRTRFDRFYSANNGLGTQDINPNAPAGTNGPALLGATNKFPLFQNGAKTTAGSLFASFQSAPVLALISDENRGRLWDD